MAGRHAFRGALTAWMTLIVLQTVSTAGGSGKVAGLFDDVNNLVKRALDPAVPAIPDRRTGSQGTAVVTPGGTPTGGHIDPQGRYIPPDDRNLPAPSAPPVVEE
jgi:hypothetical protein